MNRKKSPETSGHASGASDAARRRFRLGLLTTVAVALVGGFGVYAIRSTSPEAPHAAALPAPTQSAGQLQAVPSSAPATQFASGEGPGTAKVQATHETAAVDRAPGSRGAVRAGRDPLADALAQYEMPADVVPLNSRGSAENPPFARIELAAFANGQDAVDALGENLGPVALWYGMDPEEFRTLLRTDTTAWIDRRGRVIYVDSGETHTHGTATGTQDTTDSGHSMGGTEAQEGLGWAAAAGAGTSAAPATKAAIYNAATLQDAFKLNSKPGAPTVIYLDFEGRATWGGKPNTNKFAFDTDRSPLTFSNAERQIIIDVWKRVAETFAPFNVNVTTEQQTAASLFGKNGAAVAIISANPPPGAAGLGVLGGARQLSLETSTTYARVFYRANAITAHHIANVAVHELGHTFGLHHKGLGGNAYHRGWGSGATSWGPIMGSSYRKALNTWSKGDYAGATDKKDEFLVMSTRGLKARLDDHGGLAVGMTPTTAAGVVTLSANGMIASPGDIDTFAFIGGPGAVSFKVEPVAGISNLDVATQLLDGTGKVLASANPVDQINATVTTNLPAKGLYYLSVTGAGKGDPLKKPGDGYTNYGSLGNYAVTGTGALMSAAPPKAMATASAITGTAPMAVSFSAAGSIDPDGVIVAYQWNFGDGSPPVSGPAPRHTYTRFGTYNAVLEVTDNTGMKAHKTTSITVLAPGNNLPIYVNWVGLDRISSSNGVHNATVVAEIVDANGTPVANAQVTGRWEYGKGATSARSDARGKATFTGSAGSDCRIDFTVTGVSKAGAVYTPSLNKTDQTFGSPRTFGRLC